MRMISFLVDLAVPPLWLFGFLYASSAAAEASFFWGMERTERKRAASRLKEAQEAQSKQVSCDFGNQANESA